jgi:hypothetical protein
LNFTAVRNSNLDPGISRIRRSDDNYTRKFGFAACCFWSRQRFLNVLRIQFSLRSGQSPASHRETPVHSLSSPCAYVAIKSGS